MPEKNYIVQESLDVILKALELIFKRFSSIDSATAFVRNEENYTLLDAIYMRMQMIARKIERIESVEPYLFENHNIDISHIRLLDTHIELNYDELDYELIFDICKNVLPQFQRELKTIQL